MLREASPGVGTHAQTGSVAGPELLEVDGQVGRDLTAFPEEHVTTGAGLIEELATGRQICCGQPFAV